MVKRKYNMKNYIQTKLYLLTAVLKGETPRIKRTNKVNQGYGLTFQEHYVRVDNGKQVSYYPRSVSDPLGARGIYEIREGQGFSTVFRETSKTRKAG